MAVWRCLRGAAATRLQPTFGRLLVAQLEDDHCDERVDVQADQFGKLLSCGQDGWADPQGAPAGGVMSHSRLLSAHQGPATLLGLSPTAIRVVSGAQPYRS